MKTPIGIELQTGQKWREVENRFERVVEVTGWDFDKQKVQLNARTWAKVSRFNGKSGGYEPIRLSHGEDSSTVKTSTEKFEG